MATKSLPATEVKNRFGRVLREVAQTGGPIIIERDGKPVAVILSLDEYTRLQPRPTPSSQELSLLKASFGLWAGRPDIIDDDWLADGRSRWESSWTNE
jgi:prevent-host-death family protein